MTTPVSGPLKRSLVAPHSGDDGKRRTTRDNPTVTHAMQALNYAVRGGAIQNFTGSMTYAIFPTLSRRFRTIHMKYGVTSIYIN